MGIFSKKKTHPCLLLLMHNSPFEDSQNQMIPNDREPRPPSPSPPASPTVASPAGWAAAQDRPSPAPHAAGGRGARSMGAARLRPLEPPWLGPFDSAGRRQWRPFSLAPLSPRYSSQTKKKIGRRRRGGGCTWRERRPCRRGKGRPLLLDLDESP